MPVSSGNWGFEIGWNAQCEISADLATCGLGHGTPLLTHWVSNCICSFDKGCLGGIFKESSRGEIALINRLSSGLPWMITTPESPPARRADRESSRKPDSCFAGPWQL